MKIPNFIWKLIGKNISKQLKLEDKPMNESKKWYTSKGVWTAIVTGLMGLYLSIQPTFSLPNIPEWIFAILGAIGLYSRVSANKTIE